MLQATQNLVLLIASGAWVLEAPGEDHRSAVGAVKGLCSNWGTFCADGGANGHEEAGGMSAQKRLQGGQCIPKGRS